MEEIENDKMIYWFVFFAIIIAVAILCHKYVFDFAKEKEDKKQDAVVEKEEFDLDEYIGVWQFYADEDLPLQEVLINYLDGSTITFDYYINGVAYFESQTATLIDNSASFEIFDRDNLGSAKGKLIFKNDKVFVNISSTEIEGVNSGTYEFSIRDEESLLK